MNLFKFEPIIVDDSKMPSYFEFMNNDALSIMLFPYIFVRSKKELEKKTDYDYREIINHEKIHFQQCKELFVVGFYFMFIFEWLINLVKKFSLWEAYLCIRFEQEAYENMTNFDYLKKREPYSFTNYNMFPDDSFSISNSSSEESESNNDTDTDNDNESNTSPTEKVNLNPITLKVEDTVIESQPVFNEDISSEPDNENISEIEINENKDNANNLEEVQHQDQEEVQHQDQEEVQHQDQEEVQHQDQEDNSSTITNRISEGTIEDEDLNDVFKRNTENSTYVHTSKNPVFKRLSE